MEDIDHEVGPGRDSQDKHFESKEEVEVDFVVVEPGTAIISDHLVDPIAAAESARIDPFLDHAVFEMHPELAQFERPASELEKRAYGLSGSSTAYTVVTRFSCGCQNRDVRDFVKRGTEE